MSNTNVAERTDAASAAINVANTQLLLRALGESQAGLLQLLLAKGLISATDLIRFGLS
ncbi:hypothetical protein [Gryllotalpicola protaetiae]|uniref:hypothetical protein n=1 Tax=Gryllotalpicola protaetiae TaxID=2419771 RepID=UPI0013C3F1D4|nr:hypothetical protein [Gryllotalpicola protaetiae]